MKKRPILLGHRGDSRQYPENTLLSFKKAVQKGADGWECDLQKTRDGRFVVIHDPDLKRVSGKTGNVRDLNLAELKRYRLGKDQTVPTLQETLKIIPGNKLLDLELKEETITDGDCASIYDILKKRRNKDNLIVTSFNYRLLEYFRLRKVPVGYLAGNSRGARSILDFITWSFRKNPDFYSIPVQALEGKYRFLGYPLVCFFRLLKKKMIFWVVNNGKQLDHCLPFAYGIITDDPERMMKELDRRSF